MARFSGLYRYVNGEYLEEIYFREVRTDIRLLKEGMKLCKFERDKDEVFNHIVRRYQENDCPSSFSRFFSLNSQMKYMCLRAEIDEILERRSDLFSSDIS